MRKYHRIILSLTFISFVISCSTPPPPQKKSEPTFIKEYKGESIEGLPNGLGTFYYGDNIITSEWNRGISKKWINIVYPPSKYQKDTVKVYGKIQLLSSKDINPDQINMMVGVKITGNKGIYFGEMNGQYFKSGYGVDFYNNDELYISGNYSIGLGKTVEMNIQTVLDTLIVKYPKFNWTKEINKQLGKNILYTKNEVDGLSNLPQMENPINIAVVDFNGNNISTGETIALSDRLRIELVKTKYFKVIEREMMNEILKEQGFQQSGCATDECMVQIGRLIGVDKILGGNISKVGNIYSVSSRIISVETGEIEKTEVYDHTGDIGQLLTNGMKQVAIGLIK